MKFVLRLPDIDGTATWLALQDVLEAYREVRKTGGDISPSVSAFWRVGSRPEGRHSDPTGGAVVRLEVLAEALRRVEDAALACPTRFREIIWRVLDGERPEETPETVYALHLFALHLGVTRYRWEGLGYGPWNAA